MRGAVDLTATLTINSAPAMPVTVRLRGPADVVGIDPHEIVRTDPRPNTTDFEPNYFPAIEFDRPDFPVAVHAGARRRECAAAAVAVPGGRAPAGRRAC